MIQQFYLIYCMMVHNYELVSHSTRQATLDFMFMYSVEQSPHPPYCLLFAAQERPEQVWEKYTTHGVNQGSSRTEDAKHQ